MNAPRDARGRFGRICSDCDGQGLMNPQAACRAYDGTGVVSGLYSVKPCTRLGGYAEPGVAILRMGVRLNRLSPAEARLLGADLILAANTSEAQWDSGTAPIGGAS